MTKPKPRNPMGQGELLLRRHRDPESGEAVSEPDDHLNGRPAVEHERDLVREARLAERAAAAEGILAGLIRKPKL